MIVHRQMILAAACLLLVGLVAFLADGLVADAKDAPAGAAKPAKAAKGAKDAKPIKYDLQTWGRIKPVRGTDFWELSYVKVEGRRLRRMAAFVRIAKDAKFYQDKGVRLQDLEEDETVWIFGKRFEQEAPSATGFTGIDRQMKSVSALVAGEAVAVNEDYQDRRRPELRWFEVKVSSPGASISVTYDTQEYKVGMVRSAPVIRRGKAKITTEAEAKKKKLLKSGAMVGFSLKAIEDRPETKRSSDAKKKAYEARRVFLLDPRFVRTTLYRMLFK